MADDARETDVPPQDPASSPEPDPAVVAAILESIPGFGDRLATAREQLARGEGIPLDDL